MHRDLGAGKALQRCGAGKVAVKEQQGLRLKHENGEGETERRDMHSRTNLFHDTQFLSLEPRVCVMSVRNARNDLCREKFACDSRVCVHPPSHTR